MERRTWYLTIGLGTLLLAACAGSPRSGTGNEGAFQTGDDPATGLPSTSSNTGGETSSTTGTSSDGSDPQADAGTSPVPTTDLPSVDDLPETTDLALAGPYQVTEAAITVPAQSGDVNGTAYVPDGEGPFPMVVVLPGFQTSYTGYAVYARHMASWGFAVAGIDFTDPGNHPQSAQDILDTLDWAESGDSPFGTNVDTKHAATAGHSAGGKVAFYAATLDPERIKAVVGWDPVNAAGPPCGVFGAADDPMAQCNLDPVAPNPVSGQQGLMATMEAATIVFAAPSGVFSPMEHHAIHFFDGARAPAMYVLFKNGSHLNWGPASAATEESVCKPTGVAWLFRYLKGEVGAEIDKQIPPTDAAVEVKRKD